MIKKQLLASMFVLATLFGSSQTVEYNNILRYSPRNQGAILENNSIVGYYSFYKSEKVNKDNNAYEVNFYDNNLNKGTEFEIVRDKKSVLVESVYNQKAFLLMFYQKKTLEFVSYGKDGKELGSSKIEDLPRMELARLNAAFMTPDAENTTIYPLGNTGFVRATFVKNDKDGYELQAYNNDMTTKWVFGSDAKSDLLEYGDIIYASDKYVAVAVIQKKGKMTKKYDTEFVLLDAQKGTLLTRFPVRDTNDGEMSLLNCFVDESTGNVYLTGEYYKPGDEVLKDKSLGLYIREIQGDGSDVNFKKYGWNREIANFKQEALSDEDKDNDKAANQIWFHKFVKSADGHIFAVGEQYRKQASALGIAANIMNAGNGGSGASNIEIKIANIILIEFDAKLELKDYKVIAKKKSRVLLPEGIGLNSPQTLAAYLVASGGFDYQFTSSDPKKDSYNIIYTDLNRREEGSKEKADVMIGSINIVNGEKKINKFPINSSAKRVWYRPAKPGYIMVGEYWKKEKKVSLHLEKITD